MLATQWRQNYLLIHAPSGLAVRSVELHLVHDIVATAIVYIRLLPTQGQRTFVYTKRFFLGIHRCCDVGAEFYTLVSLDRT